MLDSKEDSLLEGAKSLASGSREAYQRKARNKREALSVDERLRKFAEEADPGRVYTLDEIGSVMGVTRERVRQIEQRALQKFYFHIKKVMKEDNITVEQMFDTVRKANRGGTHEHEEA